MIQGSRSWIAWVFIAVAFAIMSPSRAAERNLLPEKIAGIYHGFFSPHSKAGVEGWIKSTLDPMAAAGFNAWYHKIQPSGRGARELGLHPGAQIDLSHPVQYERVRALAEACEERGLAFIAYTYHYPHRHRNPGRYGDFVLDHPALVHADGTVVENRFGYANWDTWRMITGAMFELAKASRTLPIAAVGLDHEHFGRGVISYDDGVWPDFAAEHGLDPELAPEKRGRLVADQGLRDTYEQWYHARWDALIQRWVAAIHEINPYLSIAVVPMHGRLDNWFALPFFRHAGTEKAPAVIDSWHLYNGSGLTDHVLDYRDRVKELNPHNLFVEWLRPDSYQIDDIPVQVYHCLWELDGYSNWHSGHITNPASRGRSESPEEYWEAYRQGNEAFFADWAAGVKEPSIPFVPVTPMVASMPELDDPIPQLEPVGDGSGPDAWVPLRELRQVLIYAEAGEELSGDLHHLAGRHRPLGLHYRLVNPDGSWLYDNFVLPGSTGSFSVTAQERGTYALYVTGGPGGQAWYAVRIHNPWHAFPFGFGRDGGGTFSVFYDHFDHEGFGFPLQLYLLRNHASDPAHVTIGGEPMYVQMEDQDRRLVVGCRRYRYADGARAPQQYDDPSRFELPAGTTPVSLHFSAPGSVLPDQDLPRWREHDEVEGRFHISGIRIALDGAVYPYAGVGADRMLRPEQSSKGAE